MFVGCGGGGSSGGGGDNPPPTSSEYLVSFYDANLDFNGSISVQANSSIDIARLKSELNLNADALYLANDTTDRINNASYQVTQNVNFYAIPSVQEIRTEGQLAAIRTDYKTLNGDYILMNDITLTSATLDDSAGWHPIGDDLALAYSFRGIFNGNGYVIRNLWIDKTGSNYIGLFGSIKNAQIKNLGVEINNDKGGVQGRDYVGGIAGSVYNGFITNSNSTGSVSGRLKIGGIAGYVYLVSAITDSYSTGNVSGTSEVGGIAGHVYNTSAITNSRPTGNVSGDYSVGGIAGYVSLDSTITNSYSTGNVRGVGSVGGIAGVVYSASSIINSYSTGNVSATGDHVGGIAGQVNGESFITNSYARGNVNGNERVGGIAGYVDFSNITNSYSTGNINATGAYAGGIVGYVYAYIIINNAAINQEVNGLSSVNRIVGIRFTGSISGGAVQNNFAFSGMSTNLYYFSDVSDPAKHGTSITSIDAFRSQSTYENDLGWKFGNDDANPWKINSDKNNGYPYLYWQK